MEFQSITGEEVKDPELPYKSIDVSIVLILDYIQ